MDKYQLTYLQAWVIRTQSDVEAIKTGTPQLIDDVAANLDELEKYLNDLASKPDDPGLAEFYGLCVDIRAAIKDARVAKGMTQAELAKRVNTSRPAISRYENSEYEGYSLRNLCEIFYVLGIKLKVEERLEELREEREDA